jgi:hypothetical protein
MEVPAKNWHLLLHLLAGSSGLLSGRMFWLGCELIFDMLTCWKQDCNRWLRAKNKV